MTERCDVLGPETTAYNGRLQPCQFDLDSSGTALGSCTDPIPPNNWMGIIYGFNYGSGDNGNLTSLAAGGGQNFSRSYGYDALNRLSTMSSSGTVCTGLSWTYDACGNRTDQTATGGTCNTFHQSVDGNNRLTGSPYLQDVLQATGKSQ